ncbi:Acylphosphate phosphohydrolase, putative [hydrothermal vent metagenome]|uniref:acylphosphatase n=1 Tax=hydrothermal vent metagenome TaxID=652676 RepID=A0A3B0YGH5_9ZZZZ
MSFSIIGKKCIVNGRVQGVCFRAATQRKATVLGVFGSAINLQDGSVEVHAYGGKKEVDALCDWLWHGSSSAQVECVQCEDILISRLNEEQDKVFLIR